MRTLRALAPLPVVALLLTSDQPPLKGDFKWGLEVAGMDGELVSTGSITPGDKMTFTGKFTMETPFQVESEVVGRQWGDSVELTVSYTDKSNSCSGTMKGKGLVTNDAAAATGPLSLVDSCRGATDATWRLYR
jgi:hypothetical protein